MKLPFLRAATFAALLGIGGGTVANSGCGWMFHPERRGNSGGAIDGGILVCDLLWLLPGIIPGVVFLIVDFSGGYMYVGGGRHAMNVTPNGTMVVHLNDAPTDQTVNVRVVTASHRVVDERVAHIGPTVKGAEVEVFVGSDADRAKEKLFLQIIDPSKPDAKPLQTVAIR